MTPQFRYQVRNPRDTVFKQQEQKLISLGPGLPQQRAHPKHTPDELGCARLRELSVACTRLILLSGRGETE